ncbi:hypothetical protein Kpol_1055p7 [Vanderwaltozyma polyspora DSM 70294]|uniref:Peroxin-3 n=1 Tax=Vanderwaltozyma polyspora (strain ATCC 22028 / DSM 70294 / BCRC 21397 / CBS 2163 / NBRC 10782 / NRRL Y-8283 / UCD 57-17) TaxID=436907 RepID=A7TG81_VANPO|nr:uncharacterized protein Kpol_1055p7 [Vanderwaltozyma polyspora DSM 70294]EDO18651.1 hypothetical protein Kpol_1055p7 [Vanderwaltozyma polyspora DSM 70294]
MSSSKGSQSLIRRHRGKIIVSTAVVATIFTTGSICIYLIKRWLYKQQLKITEQHFIREQIRRRFTQTQQDSLYALYELLPVYSLVLTKDLDLEKLVVALRDKKSNRTVQDSVSTNADTATGGSIANIDTAQSDLVLVPSAILDDRINQMSKADLWNELKLKSLVKLILISYSIPSLLLLTRLQLNILTRREYLETAVNVAIENESKKSNGLSSLFSWIGDWISQSDSNIDNARDLTKLKETPKSISTYTNEQAFLSLSWWLINKGWLDCTEIIEEHVNKEFGDLKPKDSITLTELSNRLTKIYHSINKQLLNPSGTNDLQEDPTQIKNRIGSILLPDAASKNFVLQQTMDQDALDILNEDSKVLDQLITETSQYINNTQSLVVLESLINESFQYIMDNLEDKILKRNKGKDGSPANPDKKFQLALIAMSCKDCCHDMLRADPSSAENEYLIRINTLSTLDDLSASVYSNFDF